MNIENQLQLICQGAAQVTPLPELGEKLKKREKLVIKLGCDPTAPDLHLGHAVVLSKLKKFQELGHDVCFIIGDFTTKIGDPTGKSKTRPPLTDETIAKNAKTYFEQVFTILDRNKTRIAFNSEWLSKLNFADVIKLCGQTTLARLIEREDFKNRLNNQTPIGFHELLYPILQGYDSVAITADVELGGTDQTFNLLFGRDLQIAHGQEPQVILTMPILPGLDGVEKMSKSLNNYVGLSEDPENAFGKLMSMPDSNMLTYFDLLIYKTKEELISIKNGLEDGSIHPMKLKKELAHAIVSKFWGAEFADKGLKKFEDIFQKHDYANATKLEVGESEIWIVDLIKKVGVTSNSEARRLITAGAVSLEDQKISDTNAKISVQAGQVFKVGKKVFKIKF